MCKGVKMPTSYIKMSGGRFNVTVEVLIGKEYVDICEASPWLKPAISFFLENMQVNKFYEIYGKKLSFVITNPNKNLIECWNGSTLCHRLR